MKARIKVVELQNGTKWYYPQVKWLFFWTSLDEYNSGYLTEEDARYALNKYLGRITTKVYSLKHP